MADEKTETTTTKKKARSVSRTVTVILRKTDGPLYAYRVPIKAWRPMLVDVAQGIMTMAEALSDCKELCVAAHDVTEWDPARALEELAKVIP
jgi:hypothetical protein